MSGLKQEINGRETTGWKALALLLLLPFSATWNGFVLVKLWYWFVVGTFGLRPLRISQAIGLSLVVHFLTSDGSNAKAERSIGESLSLAFIVPLLVLFFGWVYHLFL